MSRKHSVLECIGLRTIAAWPLLPVLSFSAKVLSLPSVHRLLFPDLPTRHISHFGRPPFAHPHPVHFPSGNLSET